MKKTGIINSQIAALVAELGHCDTICIGDAGLPIPDHVQRIDLAVKPGVPGFLTVLETVLEELAVEAAVVAQELTANPDFYNQVLAVLPTKDVELVSHTEFKEQLNDVKAVIRTGEFTPYANAILKAGVVF